MSDRMMMMSLEQRIELLEQQAGSYRTAARRQRLIIGGLGLALVGAVGFAAAPMANVPDVVQAKRFEVLDDNGKLMFAASAAPRGGQIDLWTAEGQNVLRLSTNSHGGDIALWNRAGTNVYGAYATETGSEFGQWTSTGNRSIRSVAEPNNGRVEVHHGERVAAVLRASDRGGSLAVLNSQGANAFTAQSDILGGVATVYDETGRAAFLAAAQVSGGVAQTYNRQGLITVSSGTMDEGGAGYFNVYNSLGNPVVSSLVDQDDCGRLDVAVATGTSVFTVDGIPDVGAAMGLMDTAGVKQFIVGTRDRGGVLKLMNGIGNEVFAAGAAEDGRGGVLTLRNGRGIQVFDVSTDDREAGIVNVWNADGRGARTLRPAN